MKRRLLLVSIFGSILAGCATKYVEPTHTDSLAELTMEADGAGAVLAGIQIRFWHVENAGKCDMWEIEGDRTLMHTIEIGGLAGFDGNEERKTLPIVAEVKSSFLVTATSGSLMCGVISDFVPKMGKSYILKFDGALQAVSQSYCNIELTTDNDKPVELFNSHLCFKPH
ncbi:hypothetical protein [Vibrio cionasavignyae]|uniref:hypothetical protein n=1 Tax=Vibrio cionasavignyae TaxID=2910252 RepID=UPI003D12168E